MVITNMLSPEIFPRWKASCNKRKRDNTVRKCEAKRSRIVHANDKQRGSLQMRVRLPRQSITSSEIFPLQSRAKGS